VILYFNSKLALKMRISIGLSL